MKRIRLAAAGLAGLFAAAPALAASCDLARAPAVPVVKNLPYKQARDAILGGGWTPVKGTPHNDLSDNETTFRDRGFSELQFCRINGDSECRFEFSSKSGVKLWITTAGDENQALGTSAVVRGAKLACAGDGDPG
jgi:hypothetical protein